MTNSTQPGHDSKVRSSGAAFPDLHRKVEWKDEADKSEAVVWTPTSGDVLIVAERSGLRWRWGAYGWLGVWLGGGCAQSRRKAKRAAVTWWGAMTIADRQDEDRAERNLHRRRGMVE